MHELDIRDRIIFEHCPAVMMPNHTGLPDMTRAGHRYLVCHDGVYLEVQRPWGGFIVPVARIESAHRMPFGGTANESKLAFGRLSDHADLFQAFLQRAREALPNECAAWLVWDDAKRLDLRWCDPIQAAPGAITFHRPHLDAHESLAIDLHSHGTIGAFFSATDDADDAGEVKIAGVFGNLDQPTPSAAFRLCLLGHFIDVAVPGGVFA